MSFYDCKILHIIFWAFGLSLTNMEISKVAFQSFLNRNKFRVNDELFLLLHLSKGKWPSDPATPFNSISTFSFQDSCIPYLSEVLLWTILIQFLKLEFDERVLSHFEGLLNVSEKFYCCLQVFRTWMIELEKLRVKALWFQILTWRLMKFKFNSRTSKLGRMNLKLRLKTKRGTQLMTIADRVTEATCSTNSHREQRAKRVSSPSEACPASA